MVDQPIIVLNEASWSEARLIAAKSVAVLPYELLPIGSCIGRTLAHDLISPVDLPTYKTSAMDGYAVAGDGPWKIVGEVKAGAPMKEELAAGTAVGIATGAVIPAGTFAVLRWENAKVVGETVTGSVKEDAEIRPAGLECRSGEVIAIAGTVLSPAWIGLLASAGFDSIEVTRKPRVEIILLGDELQLAGIPSDGLVRDALGPQLPAWLDRMGLEVIATNYVADEISLVIAAIANACSRADIVITTGGTAAGPRDHVHGAISALAGSLLIDGVKARPGYHMLLATLGSVSILGLPGNPQSAILSLITLGEPLFDSLLGRPIKELKSVTTQSEITTAPGFTKLVLGNMHGSEFEESQYLGSAMLRGLAHSTGIAVAAPGINKAGSTVLWLPLP
ncbi:MAG: molybdopterin molybdotransferase MoeA [Actinomycetes bacterium]